MNERWWGCSFITTLALATRHPPLSLSLSLSSLQFKCRVSLLVVIKFPPNGTHPTSPQPDPANHSAQAHLLVCSSLLRGQQRTSFDFFSLPFLLVNKKKGCLFTTTHNSFFFGLYIVDYLVFYLQVIPSHFPNNPINARYWCTDTG